MLPPESTLVNFAAQHPLGTLSLQQQSRSEAEEHAQVAPKRREPFPAWSAIDEAKKKADIFAKEAVREYDVASHKAQEKTGKIEPWTAKYYAACTVGGLLACVSPDIYRQSSLGFANCSRALPIQR